MKSLRTSLNKPFYDWVKEVREADKKIEELEDKLYYYNVKLIGYNSPNFEPRLSSTKPEYKDNRYIWINKITKVQNEIEILNKLKHKYNLFRERLSDTQKEVLDDYYKQNLNKIKITRSYRYYVLNKISVIYLNLNSIR